MNPFRGTCDKKIFTRLIFVVSMFVPVGAYSQNVSISGKVTDFNSGEIIPYASIFLNNSSYGGQSDEKGVFAIKNVRPGRYELIVKYVGYQTLYQFLLVDEKTPELNLKLQPKVEELREIIIKPDLNRARNFAIFKREFIGNTDAALKFRILNPDALSISYDEGKLLEASSDDFLVLENKHLGYRIRYLLNEFTKTFFPESFGAGLTYYEGAAFFEELKGNPAQVKRWKRNRKNAYQGSSMHFYRSLLQSITRQEGFLMYSLIKKENLDRPSDKIIESKLQKFRAGASASDMMARDSLEYWINKKNLPKQVQFLLKEPIKEEDVFFKTDKENIFALGFSNHLYVTYKSKGQVVEDSGVYKPLDIGNVQVSIVSITEKYALFDQNGIVVNPKSVVYEGFWGAKIPMMLPTDYHPGE